MPKWVVICRDPKHPQMYYEVYGVFRNMQDCRSWTRTHGADDKCSFNHTFHAIIEIAKPVL